MKYQTDNLRISGMQEVLAPEKLINEQPISEKSSKLVHDSRNKIAEILSQEDDRLVVVVGPCSVHDPKAAIEYAKRLAGISEKYKKDLQIVMRVYFEKPRTTVGWKGLINDPDLNNSFNVDKGVSLARKLLREINDLGVCAGTEFLDVITPQYVADLVSWGAIGARTTESQVHRELASGLSCPVGFKNTTEGGIKVAVDALKSAGNSHIFLSVTKQGRSAIFSSSGNKDCHIILRGGKEPNYSPQHIEETSKILSESDLPQSIMIDMSHGNSSKIHKKQLEVCKNICSQLSSGEKRITGVMIESNLIEGNQPIKKKEDLVYGQSITDACINWEDTEDCLELLAVAVSKRRKK
ncbi:MAG: 3-deoxy-7-phosphoheptulonate synthase [Gammaproteobacteria bacterium]|nr:MAG: 3-deoxy-7-phosphoheptulonate synthase [Gammaproteobacteria bacterium]|tara:strand:- start:4590 stop:5645 length:1056 start_codon:yes stop_codon:yes gene_type:complete